MSLCFPGRFFLEATLLAAKGALYHHGTITLLNLLTDHRDPMR